MKQGSKQKEMNRFGLGLQTRHDGGAATRDPSSENRRQPSEWMHALSQSTSYTLIATRWTCGTGSAAGRVDPVTVLFEMRNSYSL